MSVATVVAIASVRLRPCHQSDLYLPPLSPTTNEVSMFSANDSRAMSRLDVQRVRDLCRKDAQAQRLLDVLTRRAERWVASETVVDPGDAAARVDWWHICWERLSDVAFVQALVPDERRAAWLTAEVLRICDLPADAWTGPSFRPRSSPLVASLETAHVGLGVTTVLELCPDLFDDAQRRVIELALTSKGLEPCRRFLDGNERVPGDGQPTSDVNNWYLVVLDGFAAMALATGSDADIATLPRRFRFGAALCAADSYPEWLQYWGYAMLHLTHVYELATAADVPGASPEWIAPMGNALPWVAQSVMFEQRRSAWGDGRYMALVNFGDTALTGRPPADVLLSLARFLPDSGGTSHRGLARWLFDVTYADVELEPSDGSSFGFFNRISWRSLHHWADTAEPVSPVEAGLATGQGFSSGAVVVRDCWQDTKTVLAARTGHDDLPTVSHRHADDGSFILGHRGEVLFTDPGHCCYRLQAQTDAKSGATHTGWSFVDPSTGETVTQRLPLTRKAQGVRVGPRDVDNPAVAGPITVFSADLAAAYDDPGISRVRRTWISWLPHLVLVVDEIETRRPLVVHSHFVINNRDDLLRTNRATDSRLVFRRGETAAKFFQLAAETDQRPSASPIRTHWSALHDIYSPHPNSPGQGKEGSGEVHTFASASAGYRHRSVFSIVVDEESAIQAWHVWLHGPNTVVVQCADGREVPFDLDRLLTEAT
ncbi:heparinase II/III family protein [Streptomyces rubiginosohelvolus]|uniref:heparinase II/III domain-containing protein n=1 Tax=Streptomyces rubiginosohelvolus TaxID=67362 RepID=UPI0036D7BD80